VSNFGLLQCQIEEIAVAKPDHALVGSLPSLNDQQIKRYEKSVVGRTERIWKQGAILGEGSKLLESAETFWGKLNQFATPESQNLAERFNRLLFRAWYNVWRAKDFTIERFEKECPDLSSNSVSALSIRRMQSRAFKYRGASFSRIHQPPFDPTTLEPIFQRKPIDDFKSSSFGSEFLNGAIILENSSTFYDLFQHARGSKLDHCYILNMDQLPVNQLGQSWIANSGQQPALMLAKDCVFEDSLTLSANSKSKILLKNFSGTRFNSDFYANQRQLTPDEIDFQISFYVGRSLHFPALTAGQSYNLECARQLGSIHIRASNNCSICLKNSQCDLSLEGTERLARFDVKIEKSNGELLNFASGNSRTLQIRECQYSSVTLKLASERTVISDSMLGSPQSLPVQFTGTQAELIIERVQFKNSVSISPGTLANFCVQECCFCGDVIAKDIQFDGEVCFKGGDKPNVIHGGVDFSSATLDQDKYRFSKRVDFEKTQFFGDADFSNRKFNGRTSFDLCTFHSVPNFHGAELHQDTSFRAAEFNWKEKLEIHVSPLKVAKQFRADGRLELEMWKSSVRAKLWPGPATILDRWLEPLMRTRLSISAYKHSIVHPVAQPKTFAAENARVNRNNEALGRIERAFRTLRQAMEKHNASDQAAIFHLNEMRARHARIGDGSVARSEKWMGILYDWMSDYGASFLKPIRRFFMLMVLMTGVYALLAYLAGIQDVYARAYVSTSFLAMVRPWFQLNPSFSRVDIVDEVDTSSELIASLLREVEPCFLAISTFHSLLAAILIFLTLLAIRRKFQLS